MKVSPEARRLTEYKKKEEISVATLQYDVTFCTAIPCAPSLHSGIPLTFIKLPFVTKMFVLSIFTVYENSDHIS